MITEISNNEWAALLILRSINAPILESAIWIKKAIQQNKNNLNRAQRCMDAGLIALQKNEKTVPFVHAINTAIEDRKHRRPRTLSDYKYICRKFLRTCNDMARKRVRSITATECKIWIEKAFTTPRQRNKARLVLSGIFSSAIKHEWCSENPIQKIKPYHTQEHHIPILKPEEIKKLLLSAKNYQQGIGLPAFGLMLYAGVRPHELMRLTWQNIQLKEKSIIIHPNHSKTGGCRKISIHPPLFNILKQHQKEPSMPICPPNWNKHKKHIQTLAGWQAHTNPWHQDVLRHTFASYHLQHFKSYDTLQWEMGHRDSSLLRTRYVDLSYVSQAKHFWEKNII